jgi:hypothetical protein
MTVRKSVNLDEDDEAVLGPFLADDSDERDELMRLVGEEAVTSSDSAALIALARIGARIVRERILERGYEEWASTWGKDDEAWGTR